MRSRMRLSVIKGKGKLAGPHYETDPERVKQMVSVASKGEHGALITGTDRDTVVKQAVREMMRWLEEEKGLTQVEGVSASIPLGIFVD